MKKISTQEKAAKRVKANKILYFFVLFSFIVPIVYLVIKLIILDPAGIDTWDDSYRSSADYLLMIVQCMLGIFALHIPSLLSKKFRFVVPTMLYILYIIFLYGAIFLGEVRSFYYTVPYWDVILHTMSSMMTGFFGFMVVVILNRDEHIAMSLSPFFVALFAFGFAVSIGAVWEIYEFTGDGILGLNMQKFMSEDGVPFVGREALTDTMEDIIVDCLGALASTVIGYISIKFGKGYKDGIISVKTVDNLVKGENEKTKEGDRSGNAECVEREGVENKR